MGSKFLALLVALSLVVTLVMAQPLNEEGAADSGQPDVDYLLERLLAQTQNQEAYGQPPVKRWRSCIRRNGSCDHRPDDCCYNSSCRCNFLGTNCRCQRMGLFQQWGK